MGVILFLIFMLGAAFASFLNVCAYRIPAGESILKPPSHCGNCKSTLKVLDLIPVFSYIFLRGKCRYCGIKLSPLHLLGEIYLGAIFVLIFYLFGVNFLSVIYLVLSLVLYLISTIDLKTQEIPEILLWGIIVIGIVYNLSLKIIFSVSFMALLKTHGVSMLVGGGIFLLIYILSRGGMGDGDVLLIFTLGLFLPLKEMLLMIFLSFVIGALFSVVLLATKIKTRKDPIPFGPFIILAFFITKMFGLEILRFYFNLL